MIRSMIAHITIYQDLDIIIKYSNSYVLKVTTVLLDFVNLHYVSSVILNVSERGKIKGNV